MHAVLAAIILLAPKLDMLTARSYSQLIVAESARYAIDPLLVVSLIQHENGKRWRSDIISSSKDYGLMQVHVSRTCNKHLIGKERILLIPQINVRYGVQMLAQWRNYHRCQCKHRRCRYNFWAHYKWGCIVKNRRYENRISKIYRKLKTQFQRMTT